MGFHHLVTSLSQLSSFDHSRCDAILQARQIEVINAYNPGKSGFERDSVYFGFYWAVGWLALVSASIIASWRRSDKNSKSLRFILPAFFLFGLGMLYVQLQAMAEYADTCKRLLRAPSSTPAASELVHPIIASLIVLAFGGAWYSISIVKYREAENANARFLAVAMMLIGGAVIACALVLFFR